MDVQEYLQARREYLEESIREFLRSHMSGDALGEAIKHVMEGGKRLRGLTAILVCEALGGKAGDAVTAAQAVELAHAVSLAKDDWVDMDETRRGRPAFWVQFGKTLSRLMGLVEVGGSLLRELGASATLLLADAIVPHAIEMSRRYGPGAVQTVVWAWGRVAKGQLKDMGLGSTAARDPLGVYEEVVLEKTSALFEAAADLGARAAGRPWHVNLARHYGSYVGMALQAADDAVDLWQVKDKGWDALARGGIVPRTLAALRDLIGGEEVGEEAVVKVASMAAGYARRAEAAAGLFPEGPFRPLLEAFPRYVVEAMLVEGEVPEPIRKRAWEV